MALLERLVLASFASPVMPSRSDLEEMTGLSRTVIAGVVASLVERGELIEMRQPPVPGVRGRPPSRYQRAALLPPVLLIRLLKDRSASVRYIDSDGQAGVVLDCAPWTLSWDSWSRSVAGAARQLREGAGAPPRVAVLSAPFPVAEGKGTPEMHAVPGRKLPPRSPWLEEDPRPALSALLGCPALMVNDANLAALGEARFGAGRGHRAVVHVMVADGIGAGFVFDGRLFSGAHGFSGELAHVQIAPDGQPCPCGNRGCLTTQTPPRTVPLPARLAELGPLVGRALAALVSTLDPDCVVIDSRLGAAAEPFAEAVAAQIARRCPPQIAEELRVIPGALQDAEVLGAIAAADAYATMLISESPSPASLSPALPPRARAGNSASPASILALLTLNIFP
jgi:predicted NBD/HSP70 family sugar kinase